MSVKKNVAKIIPTLLTLSVIWGVYFVTKIALKKEDHGTKILSYLPLETTWFLKVDGKSIIQKSISSLMTADRLNEISELMNDQDFEDSDLSPTGINFRSGAVLFEFIQGTEKYFGAIVRVSNNKNFKKNVINELSNKYAVKTLDDFSIIITTSEQNKQENNLNRIAEQITFSNKSELQKIELAASDLNFRTNYKTLKGGFRADFNNSNIVFDGSFSNLKNELLKNYKLSPKTALIHDGFHFSSRIITPEFNQMLNNQFEHELPNIIGISINHRSSVLPGKSITNLALDTDMLIHFEQEIRAQQILESFLALNYIESLDSISFMHSGKKHFYQNISSKSIYFGAQPFRKEMTTEQSDILKVTGSPKHLVKIEGDGFARGVLDLLPEYYSTKELLNNIDNSQFNITLNSTLGIDCKGNIQLKNNHSSFLELIKFFVSIKN